MNVATGWSGLRHDVVKLGEAELELFEGATAAAVSPRRQWAAPDAPFLASLCEEFRHSPTHPGFGASSLPFWPTRSTTLPTSIWSSSTASAF
jgi:hypothetical protein